MNNKLIVVKILALLIIFQTYGFAQNQLGKNPPKEKSEVIADTSAKSDDVSKEEKASFNMNDIQSALKKINYKPNEILITTNNKEKDKKGQTVDVNSSKLLAEDDSPPILKTKTKVKKGEKKVTVPKEIVKETPKATGTSETTSSKVEKPANADVPKTEVTIDKSNNVVKDSLAKENQTEPVIAEKQTVESTDTLSASKVSNEPTQPEEVVVVNPYRHEQNKKPELSEKEKFEKMYSELIVNKDKTSFMMQVDRKEKATELPKLTVAAWKMTTKGSMNDAQIEAKALNTKLNSLLKTYYPGSANNPDSHTFTKSNQIDSLNQELIKLYYFLGIAYFNSLDMFQSVDAFKKVVDLQPEHDRAFKNISQIYETNRISGEEIKALKLSLLSNEKDKRVVGDSEETPTTGQE